MLSSVSPEAPSPVYRKALAGDADWAALRGRLDRQVAGGDVAGLQYLVTQGGEKFFEHCAGTADAATGQPVRPETPFNLYSLTKPFTAALVVGLAHHGRIDLDSPIAQASGEVALAGFGSVRETLVHRAGFANPLPLRWFHRVEDDAGFDERAFTDRRLAQAASQGRRSPRYSNIGYLALGRAVERATGRGFRQALQRHLIDALDLGPDARLGFGPGEAANVSQGHLRRRSLLNGVLGVLVPRREIVAGTTDRWVLLRRHRVDGSAYGGLVGNARGLAAFGQSVLGCSASLDEAVRRRLCETEPGTGGKRTLAWFTGQCAGEPWLAHAGGGLGAYGELRLYPRIGALSVLLTNRPGFRDEHALDALDALWLTATS